MVDISEKVFDMHLHYFLFDMPIERKIEIFRKEFLATGTEKCVFLSIANEVKEGQLTFFEIDNLKGLYLKKVFSPNAYAYAHLEHPLDVADRSEEELSALYLKQAREYHEAGFDGMKMLEGYPSMRKVMKRTLCDPLYDPYYSYLEEHAIPVTMHVANPEENWDRSKAGEYAIKMGRVYDETYPTKAELLAEVEEIMKKHPRLRLTLAHFGFMSTDIAAARHFLGAYENTMLDLTPGGEQLLRMRERWDEEWHDFFIEYQDRIVYGTDQYAFPYGKSWEEAFWFRPAFLRRFFETDTEHMYGETSFRGVLLEKSIRDKIYRENAERYLGAPREIDLAYMQRKAKELLATPGKTQPLADEDLRYILENL